LTETGALPLLAVAVNAEGLFCAKEKLVIAKKAIESNLFFIYTLLNYRCQIYVYIDKFNIIKSIF
jgi:hypothetical protein